MTGFDLRIRAALASCVSAGVVALSIWIIIQSGSKKQSDVFGIMIGLAMLFYSGLILVNGVKTVITGKAFETVDKRFQKIDRSKMP